MKNILLIIPELGTGGAERSILNLGKLLSDRYNVYLCVFHNQVEASYAVDVALFDLKTPPSRNPLRKVLYLFVRIARLRKIKRKYNINTSISFLEGADYINILTKIRDRIIVSVRGSKTRDQQIKGAVGLLRKRILIPLLYCKADLVMTVSKGLENEMQFHFRIHPGKLITIPNFYDIPKLLQQAEEPIVQEYETLFDKPTIISVGRLHPQKEHIKLLDIFAGVKMHLDCRLLILGEGDLKSKIMDRARKLKLKVAEGYAKGDVCLIGFQRNPFQFIARADLFMFTSSWEGFPNALAEAMICGTPVISTDCPTGPRELLAPDTDVSFYTVEPEETPNGWLMPLLHTQSALEKWKRKAHEILLDATTASKSVAAQQRMQDFSLEKIKNRWVKVIDQI